MRIVILDNLNLTQAMRKAGYHAFNQSFVKEIGELRYPRFHAYLKDNYLVLHLDQKKPSYKGSKAHNAEYDSELVKKEAQRLKQCLNSRK